MLVLGGGGYTIRNVSRCWAYETATLVNQQISDNVPFHEFRDYYSPDFKLHVPVSNMENENTPEARAHAHAQHPPAFGVGGALDPAARCLLLFAAHTCAPRLSQWSHQ